MEVVVSGYMYKEEYNNMVMPLINPLLYPPRIAWGGGGSLYLAEKKFKV